MRQSAARKPTALYQITNRINGKRYIGVTAKSTAARFAAHIWAAKAGLQPNSALQKAIRKYGKAPFFLEVLATYPVYADALRAERTLIATSKPEYNCTAGGDGALGYRHTPETLAILSALKTGRSSHMKGKHHTLEAKLKMSTSLKGKPSYWKGKKIPAHVAENLRRMREARTDWTAVRTKGTKARRRAVVCLDDGCVYASISAAARHYDIDQSSLTAVCKGHSVRKTAGGRVFRYFGEHHGGTDEALAVKKAAFEGQRKYLHSRAA